MKTTTTHTPATLNRVASLLRKAAGRADSGDDYASDDALELMYAATEAGEAAKKHASAVVANAARIGIEVGHKLAVRRECLALAWVDEIEKASQALAFVECAEGFNWEHAGQDWESVCDALADLVMQSEERVQWRKVVPGIVAGEKVGAEVRS